MKRWKPKRRRKGHSRPGMPRWQRRGPSGQQWRPEPVWDWGRLPQYQSEHSGPRAQTRQLSASVHATKLVMISNYKYTWKADFPRAGALALEFCKAPLAGTRACGLTRYWGRMGFEGWLKPHHPGNISQGLFLNDSQCDEVNRQCAIWGPQTSLPSICHIYFLTVWLASVNIRQIPTGSKGHCFPYSPWHFTWPRICLEKGLEYSGAVPATRNIPQLRASIRQGPPWNK